VSTRNISIRTLLAAVIGSMGVIMAAMAGSSLVAAYHRFAAAGHVSALAVVDKSLFEALQRFRVDRGDMDQALHLPLGKNAQALQSSLASRARVDAALAYALGALSELDIVDLPAAVDKLKADYATVKAVRADADRAVQLPLEARDQAVLTGFMPTTVRLLASLDAVSSVLEADMRRVDPSTADLIVAKTMGWLARTAGGELMLLVNVGLTEHRSLSAAEAAKAKFNDGRIAAAWGFVQSVAGRADAPAELKDAVANAQASFSPAPSRSSCNRRPRR
jgi:hypothetical protein